MSARIALVGLHPGWCMVDAAGGVAELPVGEDGWPELPEGVEVARLWLPVEEVLLVPLGLPVASPKALDADVVGEEAEDLLGVEVGDFVWAWQAHALREGEAARVVGLALGLARTRWQQLEAAGWTRLVSVDALAVLAAAREGEATQGVVVDDGEALWAGFWDGEAWRGALRLIHRAGAPRWDEAKRSLAAMGWQEGMPVHGRVTDAHPDWITRTGEPPAGRAQAVAAGAWQEVAPAWRHARLVFGRAWKVAAALVLLAAASVIGERIWEVHLLRARAALHAARLEQAFHAALPGVPIVDPLVQLRRAAGGSSSHAGEALAMLAAVSQARGKAEITLFRYVAGEGGIIAGAVKDLDALAALRTRLAKAWPHGVRLLDSETDKGRVRFRLRLVGGGR